MSDENNLQQMDVASALQADVKIEPVKLGEVIDRYAPTGEKIEASELVGKEFTILRARAFNSRFEGQSHAYFVVGILEEDQKMYNTVFGGAAVVELLDQFIKAGFDRPLTVTLTLNEGGRYGRYYTLE